MCRSIETNSIYNIINSAPFTNGGMRMNMLTQSFSLTQQEHSTPVNVQTGFEQYDTYPGVVHPARFSARLENIIDPVPQLATTPPSRGNPQPDFGLLSLPNRQNGSGQYQTSSRRGSLILPPIVNPQYAQWHPEPSRNCSGHSTSEFESYGYGSTLPYPNHNDPAGFGASQQHNHQDGAGQSQPQPAPQPAPRAHHRNGIIVAPPAPGYKCANPNCTITAPTKLQWRTWGLLRVPAGLDFNKSTHVCNACGIHARKHKDNSVVDGVDPILRPKHLCQR